MEDNGQKRLILVYGEHPMYDADFIADSVRTVYSVKSGSGEIRRVNINAAPLDVEEYSKGMSFPMNVLFYEVNDIREYKSEYCVFF